MSQKTFIGFKPHPKQREIIQAILSSTAKHHIANIGRQFGKSLMGENLALYWAINEGPCKILWVSPVYSQANKVMKELVGAITESGIIKSANYSSNEIVLKNGSTILFRSAERYDNIRGLTISHCIIDEAAFIKDDAWREAIKPTLLVRGKKILMISTPKGKNWFYNMYQLGVSEDYPDYKAYRGSSYDTPYIDDIEIEEARRTIPENVFKQEYLAEFIDSGGEVFTNLDKNTFEAYPKPIGKVYCGLDLGKQADYTVATFIDSQANVIDIYRNNKDEWSVMVRDVLNLVKKYNASILVEVNSIGDVIHDQLKKEWQDTHPFVTSNKSKNEIIEGLILDMNESTVSIPSSNLFDPLYNELSVFSYEYNPKSRTIRYSHPPGLHDDTVISLALSNYWRKQNKDYGSYQYVSRRR